MNNSFNVFEGMIEAIEERAANSITANEGDYIVDGLLYCCKCNTPKQCRIEIFGKEKTPMCLCKCEKEKRDKERNEIKSRELRDICFPNSEMQFWNFERDDRSNEKISDICHNYVENFEEMYKRGKGLLFFGTVGTGKTFYASCIANALIDKGYPCLVTNFARLVNTLSGMYAGKQEYINGLNRYKLLVIDDLAAERDTEYMNEIIQNIIDSRYRIGLPTIITTNLTDEEIKKPTEIHRQRVFSRLLEMCIPIEVKGKDRRRDKLRHDYAEFKDILGL